MKNIKNIGTLCLYSLLLPTVLAAQNLTKYGGSFLETGVGARSLSLGGACTAMQGDVASVYWNPAGLAAIEGLQMQGMHSERFAGMVNWDFLGVAIQKNSSTCLAVAFYRLGVDGIPLTRLQNPDLPLGEIYVDEDGKKQINDPYVFKRIDDSENAFVISLSRKQSRQLSLGGSARIIRKAAGEYSAWGLGFDFGAVYSIKETFTAGVIVRDFTSTLIAWNGGRRELIPPSLQLGAAYFLRLAGFTVQTLADIRAGFENRESDTGLHLGRTNLEPRLGCEVDYHGKVALRAGLMGTTFTAGAGFHLSIISIDYGFYPHPELGTTHQISATVQLLDK